MADEAGSVWAKALAKHRDRLHRVNGGELKAIDSFDDLIGEVNALSQRYTSPRKVRYLNRLGPVLKRLCSFSNYAEKVFRVAPSEFAILWKSLSFALQIACAYDRKLSAFVEILEEINNVFPRIDAYSRTLLRDPHPSLDLEGTLVSCCGEFIEYCLDAAEFFKRSRYKNIQITLWNSSFRHRSCKRLEHLRSLTRTADREANFIAVQLFELDQHRRHQEIVSLISCSESTMRLDRFPYGNLPTRKNPSFVGRKEELMQIQAALSPGSEPNEAACVCLYGLAGMGKTQLALEFAYRNRSQYHAIAWVSAETPFKMAESFDSIARDLGLLSEPMQHPDQGRNVVLRWFRGTSRTSRTDPPKWLLIFDNVNDGILLDSYWPSGAKGSVIVTCKSPDIAKRFTKTKKQRIEVGSFKTETAIELLLSQIKDDFDASNDELAAAARVSETVGNHPLALDIIGCYIRQCGKSLKGFIQAYPSYERDLIFRTNIRAWSDNYYQRFVDDAVNMNFESALCGPYLKTSSRALLQVLSILDSDGVPSSLFTGNSRDHMLCDGPDELENFPNLEDALENIFEDDSCLDSALEDLIHRALVTVDTNDCKLQCHRLVRIAVQRSMKPAQLQLAFSRVVFFLNASFPIQSDGRPLHAEWKRCDELASNIICVLDTYDRHKDMLQSPILLCEVVCRCAWYFFERGQFFTATEITDRAISICETALKRGNHAGYSEWFVRDMISHQINTKAAIEREVLHNGHGLCSSQKVCEMRERNKRRGCAEDEAWVVAANGNLAVSLMAVGRCEEARDILSGLLDRDDTKSNKDIYLSNLCLCFLNLSRLEEALDWGERAMEAAEQLRGEESVQMAVILFYISKIHRLDGNTHMAISVLEKCLKIRRRMMPRHHHTGLTLHQMGCLIMKEGNHEKAVELLREAFEILSNGECHPGAVCRTALAISEAYSQQKENSFARKYLTIANHFRMKIKCTDTSGWGSDPALYDRFVTVGLR